jgi:hypothetical protein
VRRIAEAAKQHGFGLADYKTLTSPGVIHASA